VIFNIFRKRERGQIVMLGALVIPVILGMTGMAVDIGSYASERRDLQNAADSIALAAAQELPDGAEATSVANQWATKNGIDWGDVTLSITGGNTAPRVRVSIERSHDFAFIKVIGINDKDVSASAAADKVSHGGSDGIVPWSVTQETVDWAYDQGDGALVTMKYDSTGAENGNFGAIRIDGTGSNVYGDSVQYGSDTVACAVSAPNCTTGACPGSYPATCAETSPTCDGPECDPQTGNLVGKTREATDFRMDNTSAACDTFAETFTGPDADGEYVLVPDCNPWLDGPGRCPEEEPDPPALCSRRVIIIPVVDGFGNGGSDPATVQRFALIYLEGYEDGKCSGNSCEIQGHFVKADINTGGLSGVYDEQASIHFTRLTE
jgi:hypothetical protein